MIDMKREIAEFQAYVNGLEPDEFWVMLTSQGVGYLQEDWDE